VALNYAYRNNGKGVLLEMEIPKNKLFQSPKIEKEQVVLMIADFNTGHILNLDGSLYMQQGESYYLIFNDLETAKIYALKLLNENKNYEVLLYNSDHNL